MGKNEQLPPRGSDSWRTSEEQDRACRRLVASRGYDPDETAELVDMLGITPVRAEATP
jgi:hypothetical protein